MTDYNIIACQYYKTLTTPKRKHIYDYSLFKHLGDLKNKSILELACGEGIVTRRLKQKGAKKIIGVDVSKKLINKAKQREKKQPLQIVYHCSLGTKFKSNEHFDIILGCYYFHYAKSTQELEAMIQKVSSLLKRHGLLVAMNLNPFCPVSNKGAWGTNYKWVDKPLKDGSRIEVGLKDKTNKKICPIVNYYYKPETYQILLKKNKFTNIEWHKPEIDPQGIKKYGKQFWQGFYDITPGILILTANKL